MAALSTRKRILIWGSALFGIALPVILPTHIYAQDATSQLRRTIDENGEFGADDFSSSTNRRNAGAQGNTTFPDLIDDGDPDADNGFEDAFDRDTETRNRAGSNLTDDSASRLTDTFANNRVRRADPVGIIDASGNVTPLANSRAAPVQSNTVNRDPNPYAALGIRTGSILWFPVLSQSIGYTDNADFASGGESSSFSQTDFRLTFQSDWSVHQMSGDLGLSYQKFFNGSTSNLPSGDGNIQLRLNATDEFAITLGANYSLTTESASSDNLSTLPGVFVTDRPNVSRYGGEIGLSRTGGRLSGSIRGTVDRTEYENASLSTGAVLSQQDRNNTLVNATLRLGYETSPAIQPFVQASIGRRTHDLDIDRNGNLRDSSLYDLRAGLDINLGEKLSGDIAVGYASESFDDSQLSTLSGLTINGTLVWSPQRLTSVTATAQTTFNGSTNVNENGSVTYAGSLGISRDIRPDFTLNASMLGSYIDFDDSNREDVTTQLQVAAEWRFNRSLSLIGSAGYEWVDSTDASASYEAGTVRLGLRMQR